VFESLIFETKLDEREVGCRMGRRIEEPNNKYYLVSSVPGRARLKLDFRMHDRVYTNIPV
jgi:hypothetical protein